MRWRKMRTSCRAWWRGRPRTARRRSREGTAVGQRPLDHHVEGGWCLDRPRPEPRLIIDLLDNLAPRTLGVARDGRALAFVAVFLGPEVGGGAGPQVRNRLYLLASHGDLP